MKMLLKCPDFPEVKGISVGRCIRGKFLGSYRGHAHSGKDEYHGWVCIKKSRVGRYVLNDGADGFDGVVVKPGRTLLHEIAHLRSPTAGHGAGWKAEMRKLGQSVPRRYKRSKPNYYQWRLSCGCEVKAISPRKKRFVVKCPKHRARKTFTTESLSQIEKSLTPALGEVPA
ncbi:MAG: hypothetical protein KGI38_12910 [Thaumarchaeota archaeon]|nr:hypothetical protein [Nitrososphaerota archaeon]